MTALDLNHLVISYSYIYNVIKKLLFSQKHQNYLLLDKHSNST